MARKDHSRQYSFRVNLDNPEHLRVYRTLEDLNTNIHKSISSFVIKAVLSYIKSADEAELTNAGKDRKDRLNDVITRKDLEEAENRIRMDVIKEVAQMFGNVSMANQGAMNKAMLQQMMQMMQKQSGAIEHTDNNEGESEKTDAALEEMSLLFASGNFGEE